MTNNFEYSDHEIIALLKSGSEDAIDKIFKKYYTYLCRAVMRIIPDPVLAEDLVQDVFYDVWRKRETLNIKSTLQGYLKKAAVNKTLNYIRDKKLDFSDIEKIPEMVNQNIDALESMQTSELEKVIHQTIENLPEKCRIVFCLSRFEEMSHQEISNELGISKKTIENHISKALRILRNVVGDYKKV